MITLGLDPNPDSDTVPALDPNGASLATLTILNTPEGLSQLHQFALPFSTLCWAIRGAGNHFVGIFVGPRLDQGELVIQYYLALTSRTGLGART